MRVLLAVAIVFLAAVCSGLPAPGAPPPPPPSDPVPPIPGKNNTTVPVPSSGTPYALADDREGRFFFGGWGFGLGYPGYYGGGWRGFGGYGYGGYPYWG